MPLGARDQAAVASISQSDVESTLAGLRQFLQSSRWLSSNNAYAVDTILKIKTELKAGAITSPCDMSQYIAASSLLHCTDGWGFLGRAISALLAGDAHSALHLGYYAELRAAMSLLASSGIGVFNDKHFYIDAPNSARMFTGGGRTHEFVWKALESWSALGRSSALFAGLIRPDGIPLEDWLQPLGGSAAAAPHVQDWLLHWGMDLSVTTQDRDARNQSSYRPDGLPACWKIDAAESADYVHDLWSLLEPSPQARFKNIDQAILRKTIEAIFQGKHSNTSGQYPDLYSKEIDRILVFQGFSPPTAKRWGDYLKRVTLPNDPLVFTHSAAAPAFQGTSHLAVLSRAALLLRLSTGSSAALLSAAGVSAQELTFWLEDVAVARGIWSTNPELEDLTDLWQDIKTAVLHIEDLRSTAPHLLTTFFDLGHQLGHAFPNLTSHERVAIWGLVPG